MTSGLACVARCWRQLARRRVRNGDAGGTSMAGVARVAGMARAFRTMVPDDDDQELEVAVGGCFHARYRIWMSLIEP